MSLHTPRQRSNTRLSFSHSQINTASTPSLQQFSNSVAVHRQASMNALAGKSPSTPSGKMGDADFAVGDSVNVPGNMHGTVKFIGGVRGKQGTFVGVELSQEFAARGKNDGDVEGIHYFYTSIPGSGIFLPVHRAERRPSPTQSMGSLPESPTTPSYAPHRTGPSFSPPTPAMPKFSQSVGPGARAPSPQLKAPKHRPSMSRPESPLRKQPTLAPTPARNFSQSVSAQRGIAPPRFTASPAPGRSATPKAAPASRPPPTRPYSRNGSRLGHRTEGSVGAPYSHSASVSGYASAQRSPSRAQAPPPDWDDGEIQRLRAQLAQKDAQIEDQASAIADMEASIKEIQSMFPADDAGESDITELRMALREKNDKIQSLVSEFDAHRADFRSTIDTLELASSETERVYEAKLADLLAEIQELRELGTSREDVENVAIQLKSLEELVAELEEDLEDARRGEAEARGEVEFLRGEVERGRSELRREREKAAKALQGAKEVESMTTAPTRDKDVEMKDDEIRGLKAIIHSLSSGPDAPSPMGRDSPAASASGGARFTTDPDELKRTQYSVQQLEREKSELQGLIERKAFREEELERAVEQLRKAAQQERSTIMMNNGATTPESTRWSQIRSSVKPDGRNSAAAHERDDTPVDAIVGGMRDVGLSSPTHHDVHEADDDDYHHDDDDASDAHSLHKSHGETDHGRAGVNEAAAPPSTQADSDKWCALCEKDGHLAFDCPDEQY